MSTAETPQWYLGIDGEATGPLTMTEIKALFVGAKADGKTQAWKDGMGDWVDAQTLDVFKPMLVVPPPMKKPSPPVLPLKAQVTSAEPAFDPSPIIAKALSPEELMIKELGLTPQRIEAMANLAVELAGQTRVRLKLTSPPPRMGLIERSER